ncbi:MAG: hypothetical protein AABZ60_18835, partial [Planctomycetota bacterium]
LIVILSLIFFAAITTYQQKTRFQHFVGNLYSVTQLENQASFARSVHFLTAYSPEYAEYSLQFGQEKEPAYPIPLRSKEETRKVSLPVAKKVWNKNTFHLENTLFWANSKRTFEIQSSPKFEEAFSIQFEAPELWQTRKLLEGEWKIPFSVLQGFVIIRDPDPNYFYFANLGGSLQPNRSLPFSIQIDSSKRLQTQTIQDITTQMRTVDPTLSSLQERQIKETLELFFRDGKKAAFVGFHRESTLYFSFNEKETNLQKLTLVISDLSPIFSFSAEKLFTPLLLPRKIERESSSAELRFEIENCSAPLLDSKHSDLLMAQLEICYFPQIYPVPPFEGYLYLKKMRPFVKKENTFGYSSTSYSDFSIDVEIWNPESKKWHSRPIFSKRLGNSILEDKEYFYDAQIPDLSLFLDPENSSLRLRYSISMKEHSTFQNLPKVSIKAFFRKKE